MEWLYCPLESYFFTFTIDPAHETGSLEKKWFLRWVKWLQADLGSFRYYAVGEYGHKSGREHYHMVVFPKHPAQILAIESKWSKGFVSKARLNHARARYLANYTAKKLTKKDDSRLRPGQESEFRTSSRNPPLGAEFCEALIARYEKPQGRKLLEERGDVPRCFRVDGRIYPIGDWALRKIRSRLGIPESHEGRVKANPKYLDYYPLEEAEWDPEKAERMERIIDAKAKAKIYRGEAPKL